VVAHVVGKMVRSNPHQVLHSPEALSFLLGETINPNVHRDLKVLTSSTHVDVGPNGCYQYLLVWDAVPPLAAITLYEPRYNNDPLVLQYAHRVLAEHPVELTFFFVPQVVQALRYDNLGYVAHFIFEQAKISQLFCHQIIWNMKANTYRDDGAEVVCIEYPTQAASLNIASTARPHETHIGQDDRRDCSGTVRRGARVLRPRILVLRRGHLYLWQAQTVHQKDQR
jgi:phosphatidylinositol 4-kinase